MTAPRLDTRTLERIARLLCDQGGPYERRGRQLERFFRDAGWDDPPAYDGGARVPWVVEVLAGRAGDPAAVERVLCRLCDPREYDDGLPAAELFREELNKVLEGEGLEVVREDGRPVLRQPGRAPGRPDRQADVDLRPKIALLVRDRRMVELLEWRLDEVATCREHGAHLSAIIGAGSFVEGLLFAVLAQRDKEFRATAYERAGSNRGHPKRDLTLADLIDRAHRHRWIQADVHTFAHKVRDYRNLVHPKEQLQRGEYPDADTVMLCWGPVIALVNDLEAALGVDVSQSQD